MTDIDLIRTELGGRVYNALRRDGIDTIEQLDAHHDSDLLAIPWFGKSSLTRVYRALAAFDIHAAVERLMRERSDVQ